MLIKKPADIRSSEITPKKLYQTRREFIQAAGAVGGAAIGVGVLTKGAAVLHAVQPAAHGKKWPNVKPNAHVQQHEWRSEELVGADHHLQQLLRVRHRQGRSRAELARNFKTDAVDGRRSRASAPRKAKYAPRRHPQGRRRSKSASIATAASKRGRW